MKRCVRGELQLRKVQYPLGAARNGYQSCPAVLSVWCSANTFRVTASRPTSATTARNTLDPISGLRVRGNCGPPSVADALNAFIRRLSDGDRCCPRRFQLGRSAERQPWSWRVRPPYGEYKPSPNSWKGLIHCRLRVHELPSAIVGCKFALGSDQRCTNTFAIIRADVAFGPYSRNLYPFLDSGTLMQLEVTPLT
ncbi:hypothetical protein Aduo_008575 [Ancylostoma duodenale]